MSILACCPPSPLQVVVSPTSGAVADGSAVPLASKPCSRTQSATAILSDAPVISSPAFCFADRSATPYTASTRTCPCWSSLNRIDRPRPRSAAVTAFPSCASRWFIRGDSSTISPRLRIGEPSSAVADEKYGVRANFCEFAASALSSAIHSRTSISPVSSIPVSVTTSISVWCRSATSTALRTFSRASFARCPPARSGAMCPLRLRVMNIQPRLRFVITTFCLPTCTFSVAISSSPDQVLPLCASRSWCASSTTCSCAGWPHSPFPSRPIQTSPPCATTASTATITARHILPRLAPHRILPCVRCLICCPCCRFCVRPRRLRFRLRPRRPRRPSSTSVLATLPPWLPSSPSSTEVASPSPPPSPPSPTPPPPVLRLLPSWSSSPPLVCALLPPSSPPLSPPPSATKPVPPPGRAPAPRSPLPRQQPTATKPVPPPPPWGAPARRSPLP